MDTSLLLIELKKIVAFDWRDFEHFTTELQVVRLAKKTQWEQAGRISHMMGFVNKGLLRQYQIKGGEEYTIDFFCERDFIGNYVSYQTKTPSTLITEAIEACEILVIPFARFESYSAVIPAVAETAKLVGEKKLLRVHERNASLLMDTPEERYAKLMQEQPHLLQRTPQYLIAQYLGIRPESLSRIRKRFKS